MFILNKSSYPIGLDISDLSIKLVQLNKIGKKIKIQAIGSIPLPTGLIVDGEIINKKEVAKIIKKLVSKPNIGKISSNQVIACLPETKTFLKMVEIESNGGDIEKKILKEIEKNIPISLKDIYYDWQIIEDLAKRKLILIGAAPKKLVDQYTETLKEAKLSIIALESEPVSITRSMLLEENPSYKNNNHKNYAIIDIGATNACLIVYSKKTILFTVSMPISGEELTQKIATKLNISRDKAEKEKIAYGTSGQTKNKAIETIFSKMINSLIEKNLKAIKYFNNHFNNWGPIDKIFICGGLSNIKNIEKTIEAGIGIETVQGDALINLNEKRKKYYKFFKKEYKKSKKKKIKNENDNSSVFATAIGLALRGIFLR